MDIVFTSKDCTPPVGRTVGSGGRIFYMDEEPQGKLLARIVMLRQNNQIACICSTDQKLFIRFCTCKRSSSVYSEKSVPLG